MKVRVIKLGAKKEYGLEAANCIKNLGLLHCTWHSDEPLRAKIVEARASTIFESHLHGAKVVRPNSLCNLPG